MTVFSRVGLGSLITLFFSVLLVSPGSMGMVRSLLVIARIVALSSVRVMLCGICVVLSSFAVMIGGFFRHRNNS